MDIDQHWTCSNCKYFLNITKHPWNKIIGKGPMSESLGNVCTVPKATDEDFVVFFEEDFGGCELFTTKTI